ncbi:MAG: class I SAM-dependent methyltransferase [Bacillota bacterium]|nr:class I SAM-dependent methyltransferase [Bacillota bacterium]
MKSYKNLSEIYDQYMDDYDYNSVINSFEEILKENKVRKILDLACGTGNASIELYERGYIVTGIDLSEEMLMKASEKTLEKNYKVKFMSGDMRYFNVKSEFDAIISLTDGLNYMLDKEDLTKVFERVYDHLNNGGIFIFDMSTIYKFENLIGNSTFAENDENSSYIWENYYDEEKQILEFDVTVFTEVRNNLFERKTESHIQRGYEESCIEDLLMQSGFEVIKVFGTKESIEESDRIFYIARKNI